MGLEQEMGPQNVFRFFGPVQSCLLVTFVSWAQLAPTPLLHSRTLVRLRLGQHDLVTSLAPREFDWKSCHPLYGTPLMATVHNAVTFRKNWGDWQWGLVRQVGRNVHGCNACLDPFVSFETIPQFCSPTFPALGILLGSFV